MENATALWRTPAVGIEPTYIGLESIMLPLHHTGKNANPSLKYSHKCASLAIGTGD